MHSHGKKKLLTWSNIWTFWNFVMQTCYLVWVLTSCICRIVGGLVILCTFNKELFYFLVFYINSLPCIITQVGFVSRVECIQTFTLPSKDREAVSELSCFSSSNISLICHLCACIYSPVFLCFSPYLQWTVESGYYAGSRFVKGLLKAVMKPPLSKGHPFTVKLQCG